MSKILVIFMMLPTFIYAAYNPFFSDTQTPKKKQEALKVIIQKAKAKPTPPRKSVKMTYIGFVETSKGKYALVTFKKKNIVIQKNDSLYVDEKSFLVKKITSNYIQLRDRHYRMQTVYFSSEKKKNNFGQNTNIGNTQR